MAGVGHAIFLVMAEVAVDNYALMLCVLKHHKVGGQNHTQIKNKNDIIFIHLTFMGVSQMRSVTV